MKQVVWFGLALCQTLNLALSVQPYSLLNDAITGYNGACAKVDNAARRYALARSLLSAGVRPTVRHARVYVISRRLKKSSNIFLCPSSPMILVFDPQALIPNSRRTPGLHRGAKHRLRFWTEIAVYLGYGRR